MGYIVVSCFSVSLLQLKIFLKNIEPIDKLTCLTDERTRGEVVDIGDFN